MDEFLLTIDEVKFRNTNAAWNKLCLNDPWSVGYVSTLVEAHLFNAKEEWEDFYYQSGQKRQELVNSLNNQLQRLLNDHILRHTDSQQILSIDGQLKNLNFYYGRTKDQLREKGIILYEAVSNRGIKISQEECIECVRFRTICETWNGIIIRERNTISYLKKIIPGIEFLKTEGAFDHKYAVDYELSTNGNVFCAIQIKPKSYTYNTAYITKARESNARKNQFYFEKYHKPVINIISRSNGGIENEEVIRQIIDLKNHI